MKKTVFALMSIVGLFLFLVSGCKKDPVYPDPTIIISSNPTSPNNLDPCVFRWEVDGLCEKLLVFLNNKEIFNKSSIDSLRIDSIKGKQTITIICVSNGKRVEKSLTITPKEQTLVLTVTITATPSEIIKGEMLIISWVSANGFSIKANFVGVNVLSGSISVWPIVTTTYTVTVYGLANSSAFASVTVVVKDPVFTEDEKLLCLAPWKRVKWEEAYTLDGPWANVELNAPCQQDDRYIFYLEPNKMVFDRGESLCDGETVRLTISQWSLFQSSIEDRNILVLSVDTLIWWQKSIMILPDGISTVPIVVRETYIHP